MRYIERKYLVRFFLLYDMCLFSILLVVGHTLLSGVQDSPQSLLLNTVIESRTQLNNDLFQELHRLIDKKNKPDKAWLMQQYAQRKKELSNILFMLCVAQMHANLTPHALSASHEVEQVRKSIEHLRCMQKALEKRIVWFEKNTIVSDI